MKSFLIQSFKGGLSDYEDKGLSGSFKFGSGLSIRRDKDSLKAQQGLTDDLATGGVMDASVVDVVFSTDGDTYWGLSNGKILKRTSAGVWSLVYTDVGGDLRGIAEWGNDNGETGIYWATDTGLRRKPIPGSSDWSDVDSNAGDPAQTYPKSNLTDTPNHLMKVVNGALLINNGDTLAMVGYDESYTNNALQLLPGNLAQVLADDGAYLQLGANKNDDSEESWIYVWDLISQNYNDRDSIPVSDINAIIKTEITLMQVRNDGLLYFFGDSAKLPITSFPGGGQVEPAGADVNGGLALFGVYGNGSGKVGVYTYGRVKKNADMVLNLEYPLDCDNIYAVKKVGTDILIAYKDGSSYGVKKVDTSNKVSVATYESLVLKYPPEADKEPVTHFIQVQCAPLPANCSIEVWRRRNQDESGGTDYNGDSTGDDDGWFQCSLEDGTGSLSTTGATQGMFKVGDMARYMEIKVVLNCNGNNSPEVFKIQPFFS